jgi:hypothetical protein
LSFLYSSIVLNLKISHFSALFHDLFHLFFLSLISPFSPPFHILICIVMCTNLKVLKRNSPPLNSVYYLFYLPLSLPHYHFSFMSLFFFLSYSTFPIYLHAIFLLLWLSSDHLFSVVLHVLCIVILFHLSSSPHLFLLISLFLRSYAKLKRRQFRRIPSSGILRRVALVRIDVSEEHSASIIRVTRSCELETLSVTRFAACIGC